MKFIELARTRERECEELSMEIRREQVLRLLTKGIGIRARGVISAFDER